MSEANFEERLAVLEEAVHQLQEAFKTRQSVPDWLDRLTGSMKDEPDFDEVLAHARTIRGADRPDSAA